MYMSDTVIVSAIAAKSQLLTTAISLFAFSATNASCAVVKASTAALSAGEHGKGFAVVAGEIRKLADESKQAITKITSLTSNIQYTTNSTVMATEEGSKEIENVVKDINLVSSNSETLLSLITDILESLELLNQNAEKQNNIIERLNVIDDESKTIAENLSQIMNTNSEKLTKLTSISNEIKNSAIEG